MVVYPCLRLKIKIIEFCKNFTKKNIGCTIQTIQSRTSICKVLDTCKNRLRCESETNHWHTLAIPCLFNYRFSSLLTMQPCDNICILLIITSGVVVVVQECQNTDACLACCSRGARQNVSAEWVKSWAVTITENLATVSENLQIDSENLPTHMWQATTYATHQFH